MSFTITVPANYGYVILSTVVGQFMTNMMMGGKVMTARKSMNVPYPNLYATPGYHKEADAFNRVQRGHQCAYETQTVTVVGLLIGGLEYPIAAAVCGLLFGVGNMLFQIGYSDTKLDVATARYQRGGQIKWFGVLGAIYMSVNVAGKMLGWWGGK